MNHDDFFAGEASWHDERNWEDTNGCGCAFIVLASFLLWVLIGAIIVWLFVH
jgi:hypothetical protein